MAFAPPHVHRDAATGTDTSHASLLPGLWKGGQQFYFGLVALQTALEQHLAYTGCTSEIAVNLEGWMGIEEVGIGASAPTAFLTRTVRGHVGQQCLEGLVGFLCLFQSCPEVNAPSRAPAGCTLAFLDEGVLAGFQQFGIREVLTGIQADEMRLVAVLRVAVFPVVIPLVQVALLADV